MSLSQAIQQEIERRQDKSRIVWDSRLQMLREMSEEHYYVVRAINAFMIGDVEQTIITKRSSAKEAVKSARGIARTSPYGRNFGGYNYTVFHNGVALVRIWAGKPKKPHPSLRGI